MGNGKGAMVATPARTQVIGRTAVRQLLTEVRKANLALAEPLSEADAVAQSMPDASPAKWHLAHTTWFFEVMVLAPHVPGYQPFNEAWHHLFNSYYEHLGDRHPRAQRGLLTRPTLSEVKAYRRHVDEALQRLLAGRADRQVRQLVELGCHHEQQHQELLLTDLLHLFAQNPLRPAYKPAPRKVRHAPSAGPLEFVRVEGGLHMVGHQGTSFAFDCEGPRHLVMVEAFRLASRPVTNREWMDFVEDGGYREPLLWLSEGWGVCQRAGWCMAMHWEAADEPYWQMSLSGMQPVNPEAPVTHISYFEADAFARWSGARLPTEFEWEVASSGHEVQGRNRGTTSRDAHAGRADARRRTIWHSCTRDRSGVD
jgi:ergothioneine biosynthesis protein EgtB